MQKTILASAIILTLTACDSSTKLLTDTVTTQQAETTLDGDDNTVTTEDTTAGINSDTTATGDTTADNSVETTDVVTQSDTSNDDDKYEYDDTSIMVNDDDKDDDKGDDVISDDAGSSTSDGGQTISDDAGSSTSDGGQTISDDAGSSTSDGGQISDDAGSSTSDGGISDDAGSSTSDGGIADDAASGTSDGGNNSTQGDRDTDAGSFSSGSDGNVIRVSSLTSGSTGEVCTTRSNPNDFSNLSAGDFILHNNAWRTFRAAPGHEWDQCIYTNTNGALVGWNYDWGPGITGINGNPNPSGDFYVRSYPELIYGTKDEFRTSAPQSQTGLPVRLSEMPTFRIDYSYDAPQYGDSRTVDASNNSRFPNGTTISGERNVAVETFFYEEDAAGNCSTGIVTRNGGSNHTYEVMVWLDAGAERLPAGPNDFVANLNIRGADYKVYTKDSDPRYIAFVAQNPQTTGTIYMNDYIDWARDNAHVVRERFGANSNSVQIQDNWCMANVLVGTEIFWGAGDVNFYEWTITQSR